MKSTFTMSVKYPLEDVVVYKSCTSLMSDMEGFVVWSGGQMFHLDGDAEIHIIWSDDKIDREYRLDFYAMVKAKFGEEDYPEDSNEIVDACMAALESYGNDMLSTFNNIIAMRNRRLSC